MPPSAAAPGNCSSVRAAAAARTATCPVISYVNDGAVVNDYSFDLEAFIDDAVTRNLGLSTAMFLTDVTAFQIGTAARACGSTSSRSTSIREGRWGTPCRDSSRFGENVRPHAASWPSAQVDIPLRLRWQAASPALREKVWKHATTRARRAAIAKTAR